MYTIIVHNKRKYKPMTYIRLCLDAMITAERDVLKHLRGAAKCRVTDVMS